MSLFDSISRYFMYLLSVFVQPQTTKALFQAAVILGSAFVIGAKDQGAFLYKEEIAAYEAKFKYEEEAKVKELDSVDCYKQKEHVADCKLAKHKMASIQGATKAFLAVMQLIYVFWVFTGAGSVASFLLRPLFPGSEPNNSAPPADGVSAG